MLSMLLAYNAVGEVVATLDYMVARDAGEVIGLLDFEAHEAAGGKLRDIWNVQDAIGSGTWPEWIGSQAHDFRVELDGKRIKALVHKSSGHRRERDAIAAAIEAVPVVDGGHTGPVDHRVKDLRALLGGPSQPLTLDDQGRTVQRQKVQTPDLPIVGMAKRL